MKHSQREKEGRNERKGERETLGFNLCENEPMEEQKVSDID